MRSITGSVAGVVRRNLLARAVSLACLGLAAGMMQPGVAGADVIGIVQVEGEASSGSVSYAPSDGSKHESVRLIGVASDRAVLDYILFENFNQADTGDVSLIAVTESGASLNRIMFENTGELDVGAFDMIRVISGGGSAGEMLFLNREVMRASSDISLISVLEAGAQGESFGFLNAGELEGRSLSLTEVLDGASSGRMEFINTGLINLDRGLSLERVVDSNDASGALFFINTGSIETDEGVSIQTVDVQGTSDGPLVVNTGNIFAASGDALRVDVVAGGNAEPLRIENSGEIVSDSGVALDVEYAGNVVVSNAGVLRGGSGVAAQFGAGNVLFVLEGEDWVLDGAVHAAGGHNTLVQEGGTLDGLSRFVGFQDFQIEDGAQVDLTADKFELGSGQRLSGGGLLTGHFINRAGTVSPGNSIGTLTVDGDYTHGANAVFEAGVNDAGEADLLDVSGGVSIDGGTLRVTPESGVYDAPHTYTVLSSGQGLTGRFDVVDTPYAFFRAEQHVGSNSVDVLLDRSFEFGAETANQRAVGRALDNANTRADFLAALNELAFTPAGQGGLVLEQLSGEIHTAVSSVGLRAGERFGSLLRQSVDNGALVQRPTGEWNAWARVTGDNAGWDGDGSSNDLSLDSFGFGMGAERALDADTQVSVGLGFSRSGFDLDGLRGSAEMDSWQLGAHAVQQRGPWQVSGMVGVGYHDYSIDRRMSVGMPETEARANGAAYHWMAGAEAAYPVAMARNATLTPFARLEAALLHQESVRERGADNGLNLHVSSQTTDSLRSVLGARMAWDMQTDRDRPMQVTAHLGWAREHGDRERQVNARFEGSSSSRFTVSGAEASRDAALMGVGVRAQHSDRLALQFSYDGVIGSNSDSHSLNAAFNWQW